MNKIVEPITFQDGAVIVYPPVTGDLVERETWVAYHNLRHVSAQGDTAKKARENLVDLLENMPLDSEVRQYKQVIVAHDLLHSYALGGFGKIKDKEERFLATVLGDCMCWVLDHDGPGKVDQVLGMLSARVIRGHGFPKGREPMPFDHNLVCTGFMRDGLARILGKDHPIIDAMDDQMSQPGFLDTLADIMGWDRKDDDDE